MTTNWFLAIDGDDIGLRLEMHMAMGDSDGLRRFSTAFESILNQFFDQIDRNPSIEVLLRGGDNMLLKMPEPEVKGTIDLICNISKDTDFTFSGGYGKTIRDAYLALKLAKATGKNKFIPFISETQQ